MLLNEIAATAKVLQKRRDEEFNIGLSNKG
jgi:hypothetical protein